MPPTQSAAASPATNPVQARHQSQPSALGATPATRNEGGITKCRACRLKRRWMSPGATPATQSVTHHRSHTIFHTPHCHTPSFAHRHRPSFTHHSSQHFVSHDISPHHLSHTTLSHTIFHHTIFHTQLCHTPSFATPSFTHHFVTHHLSHTTLSHARNFHTHTIFDTQLCHTHTIFLCHTPDFTYNFFTHNFFLLFNSSILHHLLCLSFLPCPRYNIWC